MPTDDDIRGFWTWFASVAAELSTNLENPAIHVQLDEHLAPLGEVGWELGPGKNAELMLAISPDGDPEALPLTKRIVSHAPSIAGWEFHPAKPPKDWNLEFSLHVDGRMVDIDARSWRYVLFRYDDGMYEVVIGAPALAAVLAEEHWYVAGVIVVEAMLGEAMRLEHVCKIDVVAEIPECDLEDASRIIHLADNLVQLIGS